VKSIYLASAGRCGTQWLSRVLSHILNMERIPFSSIKSESGASYKKKIEKIDSPGKNIYASHFPFDCCADLDMNRIAMIRDPRDICVSATYYWVMKGKTKLEEFPFHLQKTLRSGGSNPGFNNSYIEYKDKIPHFLFKYEDMLEDSRKVILSILDFFKYDYDLSGVDEALKLNAFKELAKGRKPGEEEIHSHYRKGVSGDWKKYFSEEMNKEFCERHKQLMEAWGYDESF